jgi:hypothetical protein
MTRTRLVRMTGYSLAVTFAVVGLVFAAIPGRVLGAFNWLAEGPGWPVSTTQSYTLYLALAIGYMYVVTLLAWQMGRHPEVRVYPWLLVQAKAASAIVCLGLFALQDQYLLYLANFVVDGAIALVVGWLCLRTAPGEAADGAVSGPAGVAQGARRGPAEQNRDAGTATLGPRGRR